MPSSETTSVEDFYPRPPRGGRLKVQRPRRRNRAISIHALREEGDRLRQPERHEQAISIHALREEGDALWSCWEMCPALFLSTPSARRATTSRLPQTYTEYIFLSTPSARRATVRPGRPGPYEEISIHALREEGDAVTIPMTGNAPIISIHALREEGDGLPVAHPLDVVRISIHALREEGDVILHEAQIADAQFLSTPSARRATRSPGRTRPSV